MSQVIGDYELGPILGKGAFATVYKVKHSKTNKDFAMKVIKRQALNQDMLIKLKSEIAVMQALSHPHVVHCYDILESDSRFMIIMDLVNGGDLLKQIKGPMSDDEAANYFIQIASTVNYLHSVGIVHRDLKFENVLVDNDRLVITDFGLGQVSASSDRTFFTSVTLCGTPQYIAPEVTDGNKYNSFMADVWSLGVMLYTMIANKFPFQNSDFNKIFEMAHSGKYEMPVCKPDTQKLIEMLLQPQPEKRATMAQIMESKFVTSRIKSVDKFTLQINLKGSYDKPIQFISQQTGTLQKVQQAIVSKPQTQQKEGDCVCCFCEKDIVVPTKNDVQGFPCKKGMAITKASSLFEAMSCMAQVLREIVKDDVITVDMHKASLKIEGIIEVKIYLPSGKFFASIGTKEETVFKNVQTLFVKIMSDSAKPSLMRIANVSSKCLD